MILVAARSSVQFLIRMLLGIILLPVLFSACLLFGLVALCSEKQWLRSGSEAWGDLRDWAQERLANGALRACFSRIRREKHAPQGPEY